MQQKYLDALIACGGLERWVRVERVEKELERTTGKIRSPTTVYITLGDLKKKLDSIEHQYELRVQKWIGYRLFQREVKG